MTAFDPYEVLGVPKDADAAAVKSAYRRKAQDAHPDKGGEAEDFQRLNRANEILSDPEKRAKYDATGIVDDAANNTEQAALNLINAMLAQVLQGDGDPLTCDVVAEMKAAIDGELRDAESKKRPLVRAQERIEKMRGRFIAAEGPGRFDQMLEWHGKQIAAQLSRFETLIAERKRAMEIVSDHTYRFDQSPQVTMWYGQPMSGSTSGFRQF